MTWKARLFAIAATTGIFVAFALAAGADDWYGMARWLN